MNPILIIPSRVSATRLPGKPLALIKGKPMIVHVWRRAMESGVGEVVVACGDEAIAEVIIAAGGKAVMTDANLPSGSDRIWQALQRIDPEGKHDVIINVQGDMPTLDPSIIKQALMLLENPDVDIGTLAAVITDERERGDSAVVKVVLARIQDSGFRIQEEKKIMPESRILNPESYRALYFSRGTVPSGDGPHYHHIGLYAYRRHSLQKFVSLPPSVLEEREKLEQLRALEAGMRIDVALVNAVPLGVDTPETLEKARKILCQPTN